MPRLIGRHHWTCLCVASGSTPTELLVRSRAKIEGRLSVADQMKGAGLADSG